MYLQPHSFGIPDGATAIRLSFLSVAVWWTIFSIPLILFVKEPKVHDSESIFSSIKAGWSQLVSTLSKIREYKVVVTFLMAYWLYIDGVDTIIRMAVDYGTSIGFSASSLITALLLVQFVAFPATLVYSRFATKIGIKNALYTAIIGYTLITIFGAFVSKEWHFYVIAFFIAWFQ